MRKLRRNRVAMLCAVVLVMVALGAFFTPLLPFQPSADIVSERSFEPPQWGNVESDRLDLSLDRIALSQEQVVLAEASLEEARQSLSFLHRQLQRVSD